MKRFILFLLLTAAPVVHAQAAHSVSLSWTASPDALPNPIGSYFIYRASAPCAPIPASFTKIGTAPSSNNAFTDGTVIVGNFCYAVTFSVNGAESLQSNLAPAVILPAAPSVLVITSTK